jgi:hypothetical protein
MKTNWLLRSYLQMPLWGKIATPLVALFLFVSVLKAVKWAFWLGIIGLLAYVGASAFLYFKDKNKP